MASPVDPYAPEPVPLNPYGEAEALNPYAVDPYAVAPDAPANPAPWSWMPDSVKNHPWAQPQKEEDEQGLQPGLGIPKSTVDDAAVQAPTTQPAKPPPLGIEFEDDYVGPPGEGPPPPPPPYPDAISGGEIDPLKAGYWEQPTEAELRGERLVEPQDAREELPLDEAAQEFAQKTPEERARLQMEWQQRYADEQRARIAAAAAEDEKAQAEIRARTRQAHENARAKVLQLDAEATKLAEQDIDPGRWWNDRSVPQKIAGLIAIFCSGLVQLNRGGKNQALEAFDREIDRDIDAQKHNLAAKRAELQRRGATAQQLLELDLKAEDDADKFRLATYSRVMKQISTDMQQWDPKGRNAMQLGTMYADIAARRQQGLMDLQDKTFKQQVDAMQADLDMQKKRADIAKTQAETAKLRGALGGAGGGPGSNGVLTPTQLSEMFPDLDPVLLPKKPMTLKDFKLHLGNTKAGAEASKAVGESLADAVPDIEATDGQPYRAKSPELALELTKDKALLEKSLQLSDQLLRQRKIHGWSPTFWNSPEYQEMSASFAALLMDQKNVDMLGALSGGDVELELKKLGTEDPTGIRDPKAGLEQFQRNLVSGYNAKLKAYRRPKTAPPRPYVHVKLGDADKPVSSAKDKAAERALGLHDNPLIQVASSGGVTLREVPGRSIPEAKPLEELSSGFAPEPEFVVDEKGGGMSADQKEAIDLLVAEGAVDHLRNVATTATAPGTRAYAEARLLEAYASRAKGESSKSKGGQ